jgi:hypothetical protein
MAGECKWKFLYLLHGLVLRVIHVTGDGSSRKTRIGISCYAQDLKLSQVLGYEDTTNRQCILRPTAAPLLRYDETPSVCGSTDLHFPHTSGGTKW